MRVFKVQRGMSFRDLVIFNKAVLVKQCWRLLQNPNSLVARIFQAKYYPRSTILNAPLGKRPSFAWRSILGASNLLKHGLLWRNGDGSEVKI